MLHYKKIAKYTAMSLTLAVMMSCTDLKEDLNSTLTLPEVSSALGANGTSLLLSAAYSDLRINLANSPLGGIYVLQEITTDEAVIQARGGDWDDNGVWRTLHQHKWDADHARILSIFNSLNKMNFDATNVLGFSPTAEQEAQARVIRAFALYHLLDFWGQYPIRNPGDNLLLAPEVKTGEDAIDFIISEILTALPNLPTSSVTKISPDAAKVLLMRCYLNKGAFINRETPTFATEDMQKVISYGNEIITSGKYSYMDNFFDNFSPTNENSTEAILSWPNTGGKSVDNSSPQMNWIVSVHYNSYSRLYGDAGWNGLATTTPFYEAFNCTDDLPVTYSPSDTIWDLRLGGRVTSNVTSTYTSGIRPGFLVGQQYNENKEEIYDRRGNLLKYNPVQAEDGFELGNTLELSGIRVVKYAPDYDYYSGPAGNDAMILRYPDVVLMVAEAKLRIDANDASALEMINDLRAARQAVPLQSIQLANPDDVNDPFTLISERGRELYWEGVRRTDLIRFGLFLKPWGLKPVINETKNLLFPIPSQALAANPNLVQNFGY
jgi:hypothetical protein